MTKEQKYQALTEAVNIAKEYGKSGAERALDPGYVIEESYKTIVKIMTEIEQEQC